MIQSGAHRSDITKLSELGTGLFHCMPYRSSIFSHALLIILNIDHEYFQCCFLISFTLVVDSADCAF